MVRFAAALLVLFLTSSLQAATYFVAPRGNDRNVGSMQRPLKTIGAAVNKAKAGDQINVRGGTYRETVTIWEKAGRENAPIRLSHYLGEKAVIDGKGANANGVVVIGRSSYIRIDGFEVRNGRNGGIYIYDSHHVTAIGNTVHDCGGGGINAMASEKTPVGSTHSIVISANTVYHCVLSNRVRRKGKVWMQAISAYRADRVEITNNHVYENYGEGIDYIVSDNGTIRGNTIRDNFSINLYLDNAQSTTVDGNVIWCSAGQQFRRGEGPPAGIMAANEHYAEQNPLNRLTITNNIVVRCETGLSYWNGEHGGGLHNTVIANNLFYGTNYAMLWLPGGNIHSTTVVANNVFYQKYGRPYAEAPDRGITYRNNAWFGGGDTATIKRGAGDVVTDPKLVNPGGGAVTDYKLQSGSPLIDAGSTDGAPTDFFGTRRADRGKRRDIGVHEY
ncbi:MAG TPA: right-handed parallel beta-helix repeat-containing protein [Thermoanaerobaculia bacterium]|nr:right-handed parallel beta-helix repeat-containing protein [Thermoanaerobaculia bacterium]